MCCRRDRGVMIQRAAALHMHESQRWNYGMIVQFFKPLQTIWYTKPLICLASSKL